jgi:predicted metalloprotease
MLWKGRRGSGNIEDRRGMSGGGLAIGGGVIGVIALIINFLLGGDPSQLPEQISQGNNQPMSSEQKAAEDEMAQFVGVVLAETEDVWNKIYADKGSDYAEPTLVLFTGAVQSACGSASSASGPFYCPGDQKVYIDLSFYQDLKDRFNAPGDFAMAYVIAHEVGHHVQNLMGTTQKLDRIRQQVSEKEYNRYSVALELQADFFAGVWAHHTKQKNILESGDVEEALNAANAIGDDRLQKQSQGYVVPDAFTHGTSEQRMYWFKKGYETGDLSQGNTFAEVQ